MKDVLFEAQTWNPNVRCPRCGAVQIAVRRTMPIAPGDAARVRYHKCQREECGALFKSVEDVTPPRAVLSIS
jgi:hypothetical protein